ncbi:unnamed protein product [Caenorhabditis angaria]|uniref:C-type lectin domain-containing protein n=1 Tax=Caenorhabditis angaria TaxID=860376 RepID=A0A9P1N1E5_9PELO|nr:unnamed protein product [Caenorhabditis angaria]
MIKIVLLFSVVFSLTQAKSCHEGEYLDPSGELCYIVNSQYAQFGSAEKMCQNYAGYNLAKIPTAIDNNFLTQLTSKLGKTFWIGLQKDVSSDKFQWIDGTPLTFQNWAGNADADPSTCGFFNSTDGKWRQARCSYQAHVICSGPARDDGPTVSPPTPRKETESLFFVLDAESLGDPNSNQIAKNFYGKQRDFVVSLIKTLLANPNSGSNTCSYLAGYSMYGYSLSKYDFNIGYANDPYGVIYGLGTTNWDSTTKLFSTISDAITGVKTFTWNQTPSDFGYSTLIFLTARQDLSNLPIFDSPPPQFDDVIVLTLNNSQFKTSYQKLAISSSFSNNDINLVLPYLQCH